MSNRSRDRILIRSKGDGLLSVAWWGGQPVYDPDLAIAARSWNSALDRLERDCLPLVTTGIPGRDRYLLDTPLEQVQIWSHSNTAEPYMGGALTDAQLERLARILRPMLGPDSVVWWRGCHTFRGRRGIDFAARGAELFGCYHVGHTDQTSSLPWIAWQSGIQVAHPLAPPTWSPTEGGRSWPGKRRSVLVSTMRVPSEYLPPLP